jgi:Domain of Unknown Function (DUF748)
VHLFVPSKGGQASHPIAIERVFNSKSSILCSVGELAFLQTPSDRVNQLKGIFQLPIILRVLAIIYVVYVALAVLVVSPALNFLPAKFVQGNYARELQTSWVYFNPFTLSLNLAEASLSEPNGEAFAGIGASSINLSIESIWQTGFVLDEIHIEGISLVVTHLGEGEFNFSSLLPPAEEDSDDNAGEAPLGVTIHTLYLQATDLSLGDDARTPAYRGQWQDLVIAGQEISTVYEADQPYQLNIVAPGGGHFSWEGELSVASGRSSGRLDASSISLVELGRIADPWIHFSTTDGELDLEVEYEVSWKDALVYSVSNSGLLLQDLKIDTKESSRLDNTHLELASLSISSVQADSQSEQAVIGDIKLTGFDLKGWQKEGRFSLIELFTGVSIDGDTSLAGNEAGAETQQDDNATESESTWAIQMERIRIVDSSLTLDSPFTQPEPLQLDPINITLKNLHWPFQGDSSIDTSIGANYDAQLSVTGTLALATGDVSAQYSLSDFQLRLIDRVLPSELQAVIADGTFSAEGNFSLHDFEPVDFIGDIEISDFAFNDPEAEVTLAGWRALELNEFQADYSGKAISIAQVNLKSYNGIVHIDNSGKVNLANLWVDSEVQAAGAEDTSDDATSPPESTTGSTDKNSGMALTTQSSPRASWSVDIAEIAVTEGSVDFTDQSLPVVFRTKIENIEGAIRNLNGKADEEASVDIKGTVDGYSPVSLAGKVNPLADPAKIDLALDFKGLDMAGLSPYSATYAGREIESGLLDANLSYALNQQDLKGHNNIRIEKLKLGKKVKSEKAADLPLDLALAILTNSDGVIDMKVPVQGDISEPGFRLGSVIGTALFGIIRETVTAPFTLLANLVGSEQDFRHINFAPGSSTLDDNGTQKLEELVVALQQRPGIKLRIFGRVNPESDRRELRKEVLKKQFLANGLSESDITEKNLAWEKEINRSFAAMESSQTGADVPAGAEIATREKYEMVLGNINIPDEQLLALSARRSVAVYEALINQVGLEESRIKLKEAELDESEENFSGVLLSVD